MRFIGIIDRTTSDHRYRIAREYNDYIVHIEVSPIADCDSVSHRGKGAGRLNKADVKVPIADCRYYIASGECLATL